MSIYGSVMPGAASLARIPVGLSKEAKRRVAWFDYHRRCGNVAKTCRYFGISRKTFYKWKKVYSPYYPPSVQSRSRRPHRVRESSIPWEHVQIVKRVRTRYPYYSKYKIAVILKRDYGVTLSASSVGRIMKKHNLFFKPKYPPKKKRYASKKTIERQRLPKDYPIREPGDLVESDTKHLPFLGRQRYGFVAVDCDGKGAVIKLSSTPSSLRNAELIARTQEKFPFTVKAWRNDNGPENLKEFHRALENVSIPQYFAHPYCPNDKPFVERLIGTLEREFVQQGKLVTSLTKQQRLIDEWLDEYHNVRPHQSLGYLTPNEYYQKVIGKTIT